MDQSCRWEYPVPYRESRVTGRGWNRPGTQLDEAECVPRTSSENTQTSDRVRKLAASLSGG
jgi:hypothetical protein